MKLKLTKPDLCITDQYGSLLPDTCYSRPIEKACLDLFMCGGRLPEDRRGIRVDGATYPLTLIGHRHVDGSGASPCRIYIGDRRSAFKLWVMARRGYLGSMLESMLPEDKSLSREARKYRHAEIRQAYVYAGLRPDPNRRSIANLAGFSRFYRGEQLLPDNFEPRKGERWLAVEVECYFPHPVSEADLLKSFCNKHIWGICLKGDGSIKPPRDRELGYMPVELVLCRPRMGFEVALFRFCALIQNLGGQVNETCGMHIHFDLRDATKLSVENRAKVLDAHMGFAQLLLPESRRDNRFCQAGLDWVDRYRMVNLTAWLKYKTLEVRAHQGTIDYTKIINWIRLCEVLMHWPVAKNRTFHWWLEHLPLSDSERDYWNEVAQKYSGQAKMKAKVLPEGEPAEPRPVTIPWRERPPQALPTETIPMVTRWTERIDPEYIRAEPDNPFIIDRPDNRVVPATVRVRPTAPMARDFASLAAYETAYQAWLHALTPDSASDGNEVRSVYLDWETNQYRFADTHMVCPPVGVPCRLVIDPRPFVAADGLHQPPSSDSSSVTPSPLSFIQP